MANLSQKALLARARKTAQVILIVLGSSFLAYNLTAFKVDKFGLYYHDDNQLWLALGVTLLTISWVIRHWKEL